MKIKKFRQLSPIGPHITNCDISIRHNTKLLKLPVIKLNWFWNLSNFRIKCTFTRKTKSVALSLGLECSVSEWSLLSPLSKLRVILFVSGKNTQLTRDKYKLQLLYFKTTFFLEDITKCLNFIDYEQEVASPVEDK